MIFQKSKLLIPASLMFFILLLLSGCSAEVRSGFQATPVAYGKINQIAVVSDDDTWNSAIGDTILYYYSSAYPILPQPEPLFDLIHFTPFDLESSAVRREMRIYLVVADLSDTDSPATQMVLNDIGSEKAYQAKSDPDQSSVVIRDKWASGQMVIYQFAYSKADLIDQIIKRFPAAAKRINEFDSDKIRATVYQSGENTEESAEILAKMGAKVQVPGDYITAISNDDVIWLRKETDFLSSNLVFHKFKYNDQSQLTREGIKAVRDSIGKKYISSTLPGTYMQVNDKDLPMFTSVKTLHNRYALEARGIWEVVGDFMGGAFISYLIHDPDKPDLLFVDGFVHAPGKDKRDYMQNLEYIISTIEY